MTKTKTKTEQVTIDDIQRVVRFEGVGEPTEETVLSVLFDYDYDTVMRWFGETHRSKLNMMILRLINDKKVVLVGGGFVRMSDYQRKWVAHIDTMSTRTRGELG